MKGLVYAGLRVVAWVMLWVYQNGSQRPLRCVGDVFTACPDKQQPHQGYRAYVSYRLTTTTMRAPLYPTYYARLQAALPIPKT